MDCASFLARAIGVLRLDRGTLDRIAAADAVARRQAAIVVLAS